MRKLTVFLSETLQALQKPKPIFKQFSYQKNFLSHFQRILKNKRHPEFINYVIYPIQIRHITQYPPSTCLFPAFFVDNIKSV